MAKGSGRAWDSLLQSALVITYLFFGSYLLRSVDQSVHGGLEVTVTFAKLPFEYSVEAIFISILSPKRLLVAVKCLCVYRTMERRGSEFQ